jgi:hemerythrin-like domain-containing protein
MRGYTHAMMHDATDILRHEHHIVSVMVRTLEGALADYDAGRITGIREMPDAADFFLRYADHLHHAKEERVLFPAVLARDPRMAETVAQLIREHAANRVMLHGMREAARVADRDAYLAAVRSYVTNIRGHIRVEESILFPAADVALTPEEQQTLAAQLTAVQEALMTAEEVAELTGYARPAED